MSTKLVERVTADCPYNLAKTYLHERYNDLAGERRSITFVLHGAGLTKDVIATIRRGADPMHFDEPWDIDWKPLDGGPFPSFHGHLTVRADYEYKKSLLELEGEYEPPFGVAGEAFDFVAGSRIAAQTARYLLGELVDELEDRYRHEELSKKSMRETG